MLGTFLRLHLLLPYPICALLQLLPCVIAAAHCPALVFPRPSLWPCSITFPVGSLCCASVLDTTCLFEGCRAPLPRILPITLTCWLLLSSIEVRRPLGSALIGEMLPSQGTQGHSCASTACYHKSSSSGLSVRSVSRVPTILPVSRDSISN